MLAKREYRRALRRERLLGDRSNPLEKLEDNEIRQMYRFSQEGIVHIDESLRDGLERRTLVISNSTNVYFKYEDFNTEILTQTIRAHAFVSLNNRITRLNFSFVPGGGGG